LPVPSPSLLKERGVTVREKKTAKQPKGNVAGVTFCGKEGKRQGTRKKWGVREASKGGKKISGVGTGETKNEPLGLFEEGDLNKIDTSGGESADPRHRRGEGAQKKNSLPKGGKPGVTSRP